MMNFFKWVAIIGTGLLVLIIAAIFIIPQFVDVQKYRPVIEQKVTEATGRSFSFGEEIDISIFPWVGLKLTDLHLGNSAGYSSKEMISVKNFEVRLKVMPLLKKRVEIKTFVLDTPTISLEKLKTGKANWEGIGSKPKEKAKKTESSTHQALPIEALLIGNFSIINGKLTYIDQGTGLKKEISDLNLDLDNISLDNPVGISFNAKIDGKPLSLEGTAGPIGKNPGQGTIALDFVFKALEELELKFKGSVIDPLATQTIDLEFDISSFSPRKLLAAVNFDFPVKTSDPKALDKVALKFHVKGNPNTISLSDGELELDDSKLQFTAAAKQFAKPDIKFDLNLDKIDLDRYLPEPPAKGSAPDQKTSDNKKSDDKKSDNKKSSASSKNEIDYEPLRKLVLDGKINIGELKAGGATVEDVNIHIMAKNGIININPMDLNLYKGSLASKLEVNVQKSTPKTKISIDAKEIQTGLLIKDTMQKELIEGIFKANIELAMEGDKPEMIKQTLNGKGELLFTDGALIGVDLANMVRNLKSKIGIGEKLNKKPRTDFAELKIPFTAKQGLINTQQSNLVSPLIRVLVKGEADLVKEMLDLRVEPKFVATLKGQGDSKQRSGLTVPVLITGPFASPKIQPDLKAMIGGDLEKNLKDLTKTDVKDQLKNQLKGLLPGLTN